MERELNSNQVFELIEEYEEYIALLTNQVNNYKDERKIFEGEIKNLLTENNQLSCKLNEAMQTNINTVSHEYSEDDLTKNLKGQLTLVMKEKETISELWQCSLRTIDNLEHELQSLDGVTYGYISKKDLNILKLKYEKHLQTLENELFETQKSLQDITKTSQISLKNKSKALEQANEEQKTTVNIMKKLELELKDMQLKQKEISSMRNTLEKSTKNKNKIIEELKVKEEESKAKVAEAVQLVEAALIEKDAALLREKQAKGEIDKLTKTVSDLLDETSDKVRNEVELIETKYKIKFRNVSLELDDLKEKLTYKNEEILRYKRDCKLLEEQLERISKGNINIDESKTSKLLILEKNLESTFQKLLLSERKNQQLITERDSIKLDFQQMGNYYEQDLKMRDLEKKTLETKIKSLQNILQRSNTGFLDLGQKVSELSQTIETMESNIKTHATTTKRNKNKCIMEKVGEVQKASKKVHIELQKHLQKQIDINKKWRKEVRNITNKLEKRIKVLKLKVTTLKQQNHELNSKLLEYKDYLEKICIDVDTIFVNHTK